MAPPTQVDRDAIILVPGLHHEPGDMIEAAGQKIAAALDSQAAAPKAKFLLGPHTDEDYQDKDCKTLVSTIERQDASKTTFAIDLYEFSYKDTLTKLYKSRTPARQALSLSSLLMFNIPTMMKAWRNPAKSLPQKFQIYLAVSILLLLLVYLGIMLATGIAVLGNLVGLNDKLGPAITTLVSNLPEPFGGTTQWVYNNLISIYGGGLSVLTSAIALLTAAGLFSTTSLKQKISDISVWLMSAMDYVSVGGRRSALAGQFAALLEHISEKENVQYKQVHIIAYSFGSLIAIDAMYPVGEPSKRNSLVNSLVTFGCPFDFIRTFWPEYFTQRKSLDKVPEWLNIYASIDVLASDFNDEKKKKFFTKLFSNEDPVRYKPQGIYIKGAPENQNPVQPKNEIFGSYESLRDYSLAQRIFLIGFTVHRSYWGDTERSARSCFNLIVNNIYKNQPVLR